MQKSNVSNDVLRFYTVATQFIKSLCSKYLCQYKKTRANRLCDSPLNNVLPNQNQKVLRGCFMKVSNFLNKPEELNKK